MIDTTKPAVAGATTLASSTAPAAPADATATPAAALPPPRRTVALSRAPAPAAVVAPTDAPVALDAPAAKSEARSGRQVTRLRNQLTELSAKVKEFDSYKTELAEHAKAQIADAPPSVQKHIKRIAGDDPAKQLAALRGLRDDGLMPVAAPAAGPPAQTAPRASAPQGATPSTPPSDAVLLAQYDQLVAKAGPLAARAFATKHGPALTRARAVPRTN